MTFWQMYAGIAFCVALLVSIVTDGSYWKRFVISAIIGMLWLPIFLIVIFPEDRGGKPA